MVASLGKALEGMVGTIVLLLTVPIVGGIVGTIIADANTTATQATVAGFVGTIYVLGVLIWCVRGPRIEVVRSYL